VLVRLRTGTRGYCAGAVAALAVLGGATAASAAAPESLLRIPPTPVSGAEAGRLLNPRDVAADPDTGHIFVSDLGSARINEFTAWGEFVKAWGWDVAPEGAPGDTASDELERCTSQCQIGDEGTGPGQLSGPRGIAVDGAGDIYVFERATNGEVSQRVQKFDSNGDWILMFGGDVNKTTGADVCTKADVDGGDICGIGLPGTSDGFFSNPTLNSFIAYGPATGTIFVGDTGRIQEFDTDGNFIRNISLPPGMDEDAVSALEIDKDGNLYFATFGPAFDVKPDVHKLSPSGAKILTFVVPLPEAVAVDLSGNVYVLNNGLGIVGEGPGKKETRKYLPDGTADGAIPGDDGVMLRAVATNFCEGSPPPGNVYTVNFSAATAYVNAYGTGPVGCEPPPQVPPEIIAEYALSVGTDEAVVRAEINPNFFVDTTYLVEYGTSPCSGGGCTRTEPATLTDSVTNKSIATVGVVLEDLSPDTTYFVRFVAESSGGGPVTGKGASFFTFAPSDGPDSCSNDTLRLGLGVLLPDCRAYEMVSPLDKNNGDIISSITAEAEPTALYQAASSGGRFTYSSSSAFADPQGAPFTSQYLAVRGSSGSPGQGWTTQSISPERTRVATGTDFQKNQFKVFTTDLCAAWLRHDADPPLAEGALSEYSNLYRRSNCGPPEVQAITTAKPANRVPIFQDIQQQLSLEVQGVSADGTKAIYTANDNLIGTTAPNIGEETEVDKDNFQLYEHTIGGETRFACILPNGKPVEEACAAGTSLGEIIKHRLSNVENAISQDGSRVFWTAAKVIGPGRIFVRIDGTSTVAVSRPISEEPARWWGAAEDGSVAVFSFTAGAKNGELYAFDVDSKTPHLIAQDVVGVMGVSADASRIYFASTKALGGEGAEEQPNLYLWDDGTIHFIGTLASSELINVSPISPEPALRTSRVSPDGLHAVFSSEASLTGFDNRDAATGQRNSEVYLFDATEGSLVCASCNRTGARPTGQNGVAAIIPPWERSLYASHALSDDGNRVFFESYEALVLRDTNGVKDVYQWEAAGTGSCDDTDDTFNEESGGCVDLISSGESPRESIFLDATATGADVFIASLSSLVPWDPDSVDVYDARVGGGFPAPRTRRPACEGEACQSPARTPEAPTPASTTIKPGNPKAKGRRCPKGKRAVKRRGKVRCVKKGRKGHRKGTNRTGAGRRGR
jgi:hypothetical protein